MLPPVVASDLDGTIVRSDGTISARTNEALALVEAAGATVVLVTGRPPRWMGPIAERTGHRGLAICANGALVYDLHRECVVESHPLDVETAREVVAILRKAVPGVAFAVEALDGWFGHEPDYHPRWPTNQATVDRVDALLTVPLAKLLARTEQAGTASLLDRAAAAVPGDLATLTSSSHEQLLEVSAPGISKATTLAELVGRHGHAGPDVVAFGDMPNDIPMLVWAGHAVAVANAHPAVLAVADEVTASHDEDGVAVVVERLLGGDAETD